VTGPAVTYLPLATFVPRVISTSQTEATRAIAAEVDVVACGEAGGQVLWYMNTGSSADDAPPLFAAPGLIASPNYCTTLDVGDRECCT
jgi:hypothetical protein